MPGNGAHYLTCCRPAKVNEGQPHPDEIVESALLAHVSPPDITYKHHLGVTISRPHSVATRRPCHSPTVVWAPALQVWEYCLRGVAVSTCSCPGVMAHSR